MSSSSPPSSVSSSVFAGAAPVTVSTSPTTLRTSTPIASLFFTPTLISTATSPSLRPGLFVAFSYLDAVTLRAAHHCCHQWQTTSQKLVDNLRAIHLVLLSMPNLPQLDAYAFHPAASRLHVYCSPPRPRLPSHSLPIDWLLLFEIVGWHDNDLNLGQHGRCLGERYTIAFGSASALPTLTEELRSHDEGYYLNVSDSSARRDLVGLLRSADRGKYDPQAENDSESEDEEDEEEEVDWLFNVYGVHPSRRFAQLRDGCYPLSTSASWYAERGVQVQKDGFVQGGITGVDVLRALVADHREELFGTVEQLNAMRNPATPLVPLLKLDDWYHGNGSRFQDGNPTPEQVEDGQRFDHQPPYNPTFQAIARCIVEASARHYNHMLSTHRLPPPNTHWQYWPHAGFHK